MRILTITFTAILNIASTAIADQLSWSSANQSGKPIMAYDAPGFGLIVSCDNSETYSVTVISQIAAFASLKDRDVQFILRGENKEIARKAGWRNPIVNGLASFESFITHEHMKSLSEEKNTAVFGYVDLFGGEPAVFTSGMENFRESLKPLETYCKGLTY